MCAAGLFLLFVAVVAGPFIVAAALLNCPAIVKQMRLQWRHRKDLLLYDNIWRTAEGDCVNDEGKKWSEYWDTIIS